MPSPCDTAASDLIRHATTVAVAGRGVMIVGPSGSGKSSLALALLAFGADLVADDRTRLWLASHGPRVWADAPSALPSLIEARGVGLLPARRCGPVPLVAVADMGLTEDARLPTQRHTEILGQNVTLFHAAGNAHFAHAILQYLRMGASLDHPMTDDRASTTAAPATPSQAPAGRVVLVSGPSGAGRSTALAVLEDMGCETIDNMPLSLVPRLMDGPALSATLALGLDVRNRDFSVTAVLELLDWLTAAGRMPELVYLDAQPDVLLRRYSETRRRHPMAPAESPQHGIDRELDLLAPVRLRADLLIDTSAMTPHDLKAELARWFDPDGTQQMAVMIHSFSYKRGLPRGIDMVFDCRFLSNPYWDDALRARDGRDPDVAAFIARDDRYAPFFEKVNDLVAFLLPAYRDEGKSYLSVGFGCTGGQHRSVATAAALAESLGSAGWKVSLRHHELERDKTKPGRDMGPQRDGADR